ncbi:MAG: radical SAM protein [Deltaproteobacteria bacterium]|nr:radical SAM protein [Deltaproteobacteria bacterium]
MKPLRMLKFAAMIFTHRITGIDLILTRECNLSCRYCGVIRSEKRTMLEPGQWLRIIDYFRRHRHMHFIFTGGEPLLYKGLPEIVASTQRHSITCLMTNGKALSAEALKELNGLDFLILSLDGEGEKKDSGKNFYDRLDILREHSGKTGLSVSVMATVTKNNVNGIPGLVKLLKKYGFPFLISLYHSGATENFDFRTEHDELDFRTPEELEKLSELAERLIEMRREGYLIGENDWFLRSLAPFKKGEAVTECLAGRNWFEVDCDGSIKACHDAPPGGLNALDEPDYKAMKTELRRTLPAGCRCVYDFYYNAQHLRKQPLKYLYFVMRSRNLLTW